MSPLVVPEFFETVTFGSSTDLDTQVGLLGSWETLASFTVAGLLAERSILNDLYYVKKYLGESNVPGDIRRLRRASHQAMRRMGQPVIIKHMFNDHDARIGIAEPSPTSLGAYGQQVRNRDPFSYGTGYCSIQRSDNEWIDPSSGAITTADEAPDPSFTQAPKYRGYGPGYLTYIIEPDTPLDLFKLSSAGAIIKIQSQTVVAPWFPEMNDNDLVINVELDDDGYVATTNERYQAKRSTAITMRGLDRKGRREHGNSDHGNRHVINYQFEMSLVPSNSILFSVETDR